MLWCTREPEWIAVAGCFPSKFFRAFIRDATTEFQRKASPRVIIVQAIVVNKVPIFSEYHNGLISPRDFLRRQKKVYPARLRLKDEFTFAEVLKLKWARLIGWS